MDYPAHSQIPILKNPLNSTVSRRNTATFLRAAVLMTKQQTKIYESLKRLGYSQGNRVRVYYLPV
jgi:hypothetical protein